MNPWYTAVWVAFLVGIVAVELVAVFNRKRGDTISEHVWAFIGMDRTSRNRCRRCGRGSHANGYYLDCLGYVPDGGRTVSRWTWARRLFTIAFLLWLVMHLFTGGWV